MEQIVIQRPLRPVSEDERVLDWRFDALEQAGYNPLAAFALANATDVDHHEAASLLAHGCPQHTALSILL
jgi:hypothetical protein